MRFVFFLLTVFICALLLGCAQPTQKWVSTPAARILDRPAYLITVSPQKENSAVYNAFALDMENKSAQAIAIDWNRSQYRVNGKGAGRFVFAGMQPGDIKNATVPLETIVPGTSLQKTFGPFKAIAYAPVRERKQAADRALSFGPLPEGEHTVVLALQQGERSTRIRFVFDIETQLEE